MDQDKDKKSFKKRRLHITKNAFSSLRSEIEAAENGKIRAPGLGVFIIKTATKEVEGQVVTAKRVKLRLAGGKGRKRQPAPPEVGSENPAPEQDA
jgi:hypothetical protein